MRLLARGLILSALLFVASARGRDEGIIVRVDPSQPRAQIREKLLALTPLGEAASQVATGLQSRLRLSSGEAFAIRIEPVADSKGKRRSVIRVVLGKYLTNPVPLTLSAPIPLVAQTTAVWLFDPHDRLLDIVVSKKLLPEK
ncbi:MAG TPA: hypothetical protein VIM48_10355 [Chthoniobacterales bacterium]